MTNLTHQLLIINDPGQLELIRVVSRVAASQNVTVAIVGGFIRDSLLGCPARDLDLAVKGDAKLFAGELAAQLGATVFALDPDAGMYRLTLQDRVFDQIDVGAYAGTLTDDLLRRDFTADALAVPVNTAKLANNQLTVLDPTGGLGDLAKRELRAVAPGVFESDPARLLRSIRLAAESGFKIVPATEQLIAENAHLASEVAGERTREDLVKLFSLPSAGTVIEYLDRLGLLTAIFPELEPSRGVDQPIEHNWDVLGHQIRTVAALDWVLRRGDWLYAPAEAQAIIPFDDDVAAYFAASINGGASRLALTRLGALIHDIAKPETKTLAPSGRVRFYGHADRGAETAAGMLTRLRFSQKEIKFVTAMIEAHMRPTQMSPDSSGPTPKAVYRFLRDTGEAATATLYLSLADHLAARGPTLVLDNFREHVTIVAYVLAERTRQREKTPKRLIDGNELQLRFNLKPGPDMGRILETVAEAQATGEVNNKEEALALTRRLIEEYRRAQ